jgi:hypothetical protein
MRAPDPCPCPGCSLITGPPRLATQVHPPMKPLPLGVPHHLSAVRPVGRNSFLEFVSLQRRPSDLPRMGGMPPPPRFRSQAFSTSQRFPSTSKLRGLVSCRSRSWDSPFRVFPSQESCTPLEATSSLVVIHRRAGRRLLDLSPPVSPTPTPSRGCLASPASYGLPFHAPRPASRLPWIQVTELARSASFTHFEALLLLRVRSCRPESPQTPTPILSWVSASLELSPPTPRNLDPPGPRGPAHAPSSEDSGHDPKDWRPSRRVRPFQHIDAPKQSRRQLPTP